MTDPDERVHVREGAGRAMTAAEAKLWDVVVQAMNALSADELAERRRAAFELGDPGATVIPHDDGWLEVRWAGRPLSCFHVDEIEG